MNRVIYFMISLPLWFVSVAQTYACANHPIAKQADNQDMDSTIPTMRDLPPYDTQDVYNFITPRPIVSRSPKIDLSPPVKLTNNEKHHALELVMTQERKKLKTDMQNLELAKIDASAVCRFGAFAEMWRKQMLSLGHERSNEYYKACRAVKDRLGEAEGKAIGIALDVKYRKQVLERVSRVDRDMRGRMQPLFRGPVGERGSMTVKGLGNAGVLKDRRKEKGGR